MALGTLGSTLNDELNRLANGGTYRDMGQMVDEALAAKQWANRENINPYSTDTVGILNEIAGLGLDKKNWLDFNGVCNYIAGTTGLPAAAALRQVYPTTDLLTGVASFYTDAATPRYNYPGYVYNAGLSGQYISVPDESALRITGDIDVRVKVALNDWTPTSDQCVLSKFSTSNIGWQFGVAATAGVVGRLFFAYSGNGTTYRGDYNSTVAPTVADGSALWIRATFATSTGTVKFYTSTDGTNWTQLGTDVAGFATTLYASTAPILIGANRIDLSGGNISSGKFYQAQVYSGINGTKVFDADLTTNVTSATYDTFTATTGQLCTINGQNTLTNAGTAGSLLPVTVGSSTAADSNDPKFLDFTGTNYVYLPGVANNKLTVPDEAALDITGDIDIRVYVANDSWTQSETFYASKYTTSGNQRSYEFFSYSDGKLYFNYSTDGTNDLTAVSTVATGFAAGSANWVRVTRVSSTGIIKFYTSTDGTIWTQLGADISGTSGNLFSSTSNLAIGDRVTNTNQRAFKFYRLQILNGINGTTVLDVDTSVITTGSATSFTAVTGQTVTINRSTSGRKTVAVTQPTWLFGTDDYMEVNNRYMSSGTYLYLPGVNSNNATAPDSAALSITGDIDIRCKVAMDDWTPSTISTLVNKLGASGNRSYELYVATSGKLGYIWSSTGSTVTTKESSVATGIADGATKWVRVTHDVDNGASGNDIIFYTSDDGITWTQLGTTTTTAGTTSIYDSTASLEVGTENNAQPARGKFFRAQVLNGIGGTVAFDANFETSITSLLQTSFTESSANAATVTINRNGSAYRSAGITTAGYLYPGATNTFAASATDFLNFGASQDFTVLAVQKQWTTFTAQQVTIAKKDAATTTPGYVLRNGAGTPSAIVGTITDTGGVDVSNTTASRVSGTSYVISLVRSTGADTAYLYLNNTVVSTTDTTTAGFSNPYPLRIGRYSDAGTQYPDMELYAAAVFRQALTASQVRQISNYFANREVYL